MIEYYEYDGDNERQAMEQKVKDDKISNKNNEMAKHGE